MSSPRADIRSVHSTYIYKSIYKGEVSLLSAGAQKSHWCIACLRLLAEHHLSAAGSNAKPESVATHRA
jgi:hypothetical protein